MPRPRILDEAAEELADAAAWLEASRPGYAHVFLQAYEDKLRQIERFSESGSNIESPPPGVQLQSFRIRKFLFAIIVGELDGDLTIVAVAHPSRKPGYWRDRLK